MEEMSTYESNTNTNTNMNEETTTIEQKETECQELKNIQYKSMLLNGTNLPKTKSTNNLSMLDTFLEEEKKSNMNESWTKLNKTMKTQKLLDYVKTYKEKHDLTSVETTKLIDFLKDCIDRKKLHRVKDVSYDKETGIIKDIPPLCYIKQTHHFTLKNIDKRVSTLKSLAPKKLQGTHKNKVLTKKGVDSDEENGN